MSTAMRLENILGFTPPSVDRETRSLHRVRISASALPEIFARWKAYAAGELPGLTGITVSPADESRLLLNLLLDLGSEAPMVCVEFDLAKGAALPDFSLVWPHCRWWQEELSVFAGLQFGPEAGGAKGGVSWRRA
jgi:hypothetical protein